MDAGVRGEVVAIAVQSRLALGFAAQPAVLIGGLNTNSLDEAERQRAVDTLKQHIDTAKEMGAIGFAFLSGKDPGEAKRSAATDVLVKSIQTLCDHAGSLPVLLETFDRTIDKKALIGPNAEAVRVAERVGRKNFGLMLDLSHLPLQGEKPREALKVAQAHLKHAHIGNCVMADPTNPVYGDNHPRFGYPGGENDVEELVEYLRVLLEIGYLNPERRPVLSFEVKPQGKEESALIIAHSKRTLAEAWAKA
jgi:sugar phosphate isomerase/epimerase